eukprot:m.131940 g.131940  ORF g.131940 m.131940 type:complete len:218 (+) comp13927_c0_seq2:217-870(+)
MACRDEHAAFGGHGHSHDGGGHGHSHDDPERGLESSLFDSIDHDKVRCLNESEPQAIRKVLRPHHQKLEPDMFVESDADEELIVVIPFCNDVTIKSICVVSEHGEQAPARMKAYINQDSLDFDNITEAEPTQEWDLVHGDHSYETKIVKFGGLHCLTLFFDSNFGADTTKINFIGFYGVFNKVVRRSYIKVAEVAARPVDHKGTIKEHTTNSSKTIQ